MQKIESSKKYKFGIQVWESNKGPELGYCGWALHLYIPSLDSWYKLDGSFCYYPLHPDRAEAAANDALKMALEGWYDERIEAEIITPPTRKANTLAESRSM